MKREFVPLAQPYRNENLGGLLASIKLDGMRAVWVPPTRGMKKEEVPFANRPDTWSARDQGHTATGLWSRNGNIIHAPSHFLDKLPEFPVDLELYAGPGSFQLLRSIVSRFDPDLNWDLVYACVLDAVDMKQFLRPGNIQTRTANIIITEAAFSWWLRFGAKSVPSMLGFKQRYEWLLANGIEPIQQIELPSTPLAATEAADRLLDSVLAEGGEGLIYRQPFDGYQCARTRGLLKHKPVQDADAVVIGYYWGKEPDMRKSLTGTAVGSRLGVMGGVLVDMDGKRFILSGTGFPYADCQMLFKETGICAADVGIDNPGKLITDDIYNPKYPPGSILTFTYRSFTNDGIPVEARFKRRRM